MQSMERILKRQAGTRDISESRFLGVIQHHSAQTVENLTRIYTEAVAKSDMEYMTHTAQLMKAHENTTQILGAQVDSHANLLGRAMNLRTLELERTRSRVLLANPEPVLGIIVNTTIATTSGAKTSTFQNQQTEKALLTVAQATQTEVQVEIPKKGFVIHPRVVDWIAASGATSGVIFGGRHVLRKGVNKLSEKVTENLVIAAENPQHFSHYEDANLRLENAFMKLKQDQMRIEQAPLRLQSTSLNVISPLVQGAARTAMAYAPLLWFVFFIINIHKISDAVTSRM